MCYYYIVDGNLMIIRDGDINMNISYNNLWKLLIDKNMKKKDLRRLTGISTVCMAKLGKNESVNMDTLVRICEALNCDISDIVEIKESKEKNNA